MTARVGARRALLALALALALTAAACSTPAAPTGEDGLRRIAQRFLEPGADPVAIALDLRPADAEYAAVFRSEHLVDALRHYAGYWEHPGVPGPAPGQTEATTGSVTTEELAAGTGESARFPGGFRTAAPALAPGLRIHQITFHAPGQTVGVAVAGFVEVDGNWRLVPAPWEVLLVEQPGHRH
ncbi:hypothetical protein [Pseudonocardia broussonetiae]|uniref:Lipoprotein n=1 Tax=Pseudonocardia broussonetiae TaxID=2736640 RepID=A0A6M6JI39_9PSEU|nr:hypothetical protein [Pseudonocardia broussonetiae]QJY47688.1 hypothetical protein HOP40_19305 [Pseudonocardia broussonetiae]